MPTIPRRLSKCVSLPNSSESVLTSGGSILSKVRVDGDLSFSSTLDVRGLVIGSNYIIIYDSNSNIITSGIYIKDPTYYSPANAYSESDSVTLYHLKYGYKYNKGNGLLRRGNTLVYISQDINTNVTLSEADALALSGVAVDKANKTVTISVTRSQSEIYDYLQAYQSQIANVDTLFDGEIFSTILGNTFNINNGWSFIFSVAPSGLFNITGLAAFTNVFAVSDFNTSSNIHFTLSGTWDINNSSINSVSSNIPNVVINPTGSTVITNNLDAVNITINAPQPTLTISNIVAGSQLVLHDLDNADPQNKGTELLRNNNVTADVAYVGTAGNLISISVYEAGYRNFYSEYTVSASDANFTVNQQIETN